MKKSLGQSFIEGEIKCLFKSLLLCIVLIVVLCLDNDLCQEQKEKLRNLYFVDLRCLAAAGGLCQEAILEFKPHSKSLQYSR